MRKNLKNNRKLSVDILDELYYFIDSDYSLNVIRYIHNASVILFSVFSFKYLS